jgi:hypothetical protein
MNPTICTKKKVMNPTIYSNIKLVRNAQFKFKNPQISTIKDALGYIPSTNKLIFLFIRFPKASSWFQFFIASPFNIIDYIFIFSFMIYYTYILDMLAISFLFLAGYSIAGLFNI